MGARRSGVPAMGGGGRRRILFLYQDEAPFVHTDIRILEEAYDVEAVNAVGGTTMGSILRALRRVDLSLSWFALGYAARAVLGGKIARRPSVVIAGGWDVISMPEIDYGAARTFRGRARARFVIRNADVLLTFSSWSQETMRRLAGRRAELIHLGVDLDRWRPGRKEDLVVTVGQVKRENFSRKGLETFVRAASHLPEVRFVLAGKHYGDDVEALRAIASPNVEFPGFLPDDALRDLLARAKVYVQVSYNEGFGLSVAEAMASGCVPVATRMGSLPEVVGDVGLFAPFGDANATASAIQEALTSARGPSARERVAAQFPVSRRRERLLSLVEGLVGA